MLSLDYFDLSYTEFGILALVGLFIGMAKVGISGTGMIAVPLLAIYFGGKNSSGLMLPILIFADFFGVRYYHRHAQWGHLRRLLPYAIIGVLLGTWVGTWIDDVLFRQIMAFVIFASVGIMVYQERFGSQLIPKGRWFAILLGILGGFTTMVGNLAGAVMALYLLAMRLPKNDFIGTAAWFFLIINLIKVPFHIVFWKTITWDSFLMNLTTIPLIALGAFLGIRIVKLIPELHYRWFIILMTAAAAVFMLF